jgi:hypothetical protein
MPKRFTTIGGIMFGVIAVAQAARIFYAADVVVNGYHVPMAISYAVAGIAAVLCVMLFREAQV